MILIKILGVNLNLYFVVYVVNFGVDDGILFKVIGVIGVEVFEV